MPQKKKDTSFAYCAWVGFKAHKGQVVADALSAIPVATIAGKIGKELSATAEGAISAGQWHLSAASGLYSGLKGETTGAVLGGVGYGVAVLDAGKVVAGLAVPEIALAVGVVAVGADVVGSEEYRACRAGEGC